MRPAGLRAGAGEAFAAEGLNAHHRADHAAVDVDVADTRAAHHVVDETLDAALYAEGEAVADVAQPLQDLVEVLAAVGADVEDRTEDLDLRQLVERELERDRRNIVAGGGSLCFSNHF